MFGLRIPRLAAAATTPGFTLVVEPGSGGGGRNGSSAGTR